MSTRKRVRDSEKELIHLHFVSNMNLLGFFSDGTVSRDMNDVGGTDYHITHSFHKVDQLSIDEQAFLANYIIINSNLPTYALWIYTESIPNELRDNLGDLLTPSFSSYTKRNLPNIPYLNVVKFFIKPVQVIGGGHPPSAGNQFGGNNIQNNGSVSISRSDSHSHSYSFHIPQTGGGAILRKSCPRRKCKSRRTQSKRRRRRRSSRRTRRKSRKSHRKSRR
jgi:hypothetical protein